MTMIASRRTFLAGVGATLVVPLIARGPATAATPEGNSALKNAYLKIDADGGITLSSPTSEMGQGTQTAHAAIVADELGVDIQTVRVIVPDRPADAYRWPFGGNLMRSTGSFGVRLWLEPLRVAAAQARAVLQAAAAERWGVAVDAVDIVDGRLIEREGSRSADLTEVLEAAARLPLPDEPALRDAADRRYVGQAVARIDTPAKVNGSAVFGIDVTLPDMLYGAVRLSPVFKGEPARIDEGSAPDARAVVPVPGGAVVVADRWWATKTMAEELDIDWASSPHQTVSSASLAAAFAAGLDAPDALPVIAEGDLEDPDLERHARVAARYNVPFLAHMSMEPLTCLARVTPDRCEVWLSTQAQDIVHRALMELTGLPAEQVFVHTTFLGGGFGRKLHAEVAIQAALASQAVDERPVKVIWTREVDTQYGQYRPAMAAQLSGSIDEAGRISALDVRLAGPLMGREYFFVEFRGNMDVQTHAIFNAMPYSVGALRLTHVEVPVPPPLCPWRAVSASQNGYFLESFMDELAVLAGADPLDFRRAHVEEGSARRAVLDRLEAVSGWRDPLPGPNWGRGVAFAETYGSRCAQVAEVEMVDGEPQVRRVVVVLDCGEAINPGQVEAQVTGSVIDALGPTLRCQITLEEGRAVQSNYHDYPIIRSSEAPIVEVHLIESDEPIGGVGEPAVPPLAPAVINAIAAASGRRHRSLPIVEA